MFCYNKKLCSARLQQPWRWLRHYYASRLRPPPTKYPNRVVQLIVPFPPGGGVDTEGRVDRAEAD